MASGIRRRRCVGHNVAASLHGESDSAGCVRSTYENTILCARHNCSELFNTFPYTCLARGADAVHVGTNVYRTAAGLQGAVLHEGSARLLHGHNMFPGKHSMVSVEGVRSCMRNAQVVSMSYWPHVT